MVNLSAVYDAANKGDWRAAAWALEHKEPMKYGGKQTHDVSLNIPDKNADAVEARVEKFFNDIKHRQQVNPCYSRNTLFEIGLRSITAGIIALAGYRNRFGKGKIHTLPRIYG